MNSKYFIIIALFLLSVQLHTWAICYAYEEQDEQREKYIKAPRTIVFPENAYIQNDTFPAATMDIVVTECIFAGKQVTDGTMGANVLFMAGNKVVLEEGFYVQKGATFVACTGNFLSSTNTMQRTSKRNKSTSTSDGIVTILDTESIKTILVYNSAGQLVMRSGEKSLDISSFPQGVYIIKMILLNGEYITEKIVKP